MIRLFNPFQPSRSLMQEGRRKEAEGKREECLYSKLFHLFGLVGYFRRAALVLDQPKINGLGRTRGRGDGETRRIFTRQSDCGGLLVTSSWLAWFVFGSGLSINLTPAYGQQRLPEPRIFEELPPPSYSPSLPSIPTFGVPTSPSSPASPSPIPTFGVPTSPSSPASPSPIPTFDVPTSPSPATASDTVIPGRELNFEAPAPNPSLPSRRSRLDTTLYRVDIYGDNSFVLSQVKQIEPSAFVRQEDGVIQAGVFSNEYNAQLRVRELAAQGIRSQITPIATEGNMLTVTAESFSANRTYFVVIPGNSEDLPNIEAEVMTLGIGQSAVSRRTSPRGPHVAIGPFDNRGEANRWSNYLRSIGMDARVYFGN